MKLLPYTLACSGLLALGFVSKTRPVYEAYNMKVSNSTYAPVAVLELFTSEGCSSCPPADRLLPELMRSDSNVIALSFHVDYWDYLGWKDPYSNKKFSERQRNYADQMHLESSYTPQLVVNGQYELVGSIRSQAQQAIQKALKENSSVSLSVQNAKQQDKKISFAVSALGDLKNTTILAALVQKEAVVKIKAGENSGVTLSHTNIVRSFLSKDAAATTGFEFTLPADVSTGNWQVVVYSQRKDDLKITGAAVYRP